jgi:prepilin-type N-terminal cleavage/methylation domain-containing protein
MKLQSMKTMERGTQNSVRSRVHRQGFSLIEMIGVLAVIAVVAAMLAPAFIKRIDRAARTKETADLNAIGDAYIQSILRNKIIPSDTSWAAAVASQMSLPTTAIATNARRYARAFLIDQDLRIDGTVPALPYAQTTNGTTTKPVSPRLIIISSLDRNLPLSSGLHSRENFTNIWNAAEDAIPAAPAFNGWTGKGEDLRIKRLNLEPLFHQLILINHDSTTTPKFDIDNTGILGVTTNGAGWNSYYLDGTVLGLRDGNGVVQTRYLMKRSISFVFESGSWRGQLSGGKPISGAALEFLNRAATFIDNDLNWRAPAGASQYSALVAMYTYLFMYTLWANECPHFDDHGNSSVASQPEYQMLDDQGANQGHVDTFTKAVIN